jgi:hypothetical protein
MLPRRFPKPCPLASLLSRVPDVEAGSNLPEGAGLKGEHARALWWASALRGARFPESAGFRSGRLYWNRAPEDWFPQSGFDGLDDLSLDCLSAAGIAVHVGRRAPAAAAAAAAGAGPVAFAVFQAGNEDVTVSPAPAFSLADLLAERQALTHDPVRRAHVAGLEQVTETLYQSAGAVARVLRRLAEAGWSARPAAASVLFFPALVPDESDSLLATGFGCGDLKGVPLLTELDSAVPCEDEAEAYAAAVNCLLSCVDAEFGAAAAAPIRRKLQGQTVKGATLPTGELSDDFERLRFAGVAEFKGAASLLGCSSPRGAQPADEGRAYAVRRSIQLASA